MAVKLFYKLFLASNQKTMLYFLCEKQTKKYRANLYVLLHINTEGVVFSKEF
ncbi:hypothetical protein BH23BAC3_BH23BAC3_32290 [soil metagenome]